jgi:hypothetical protein
MESDDGELVVAGRHCVRRGYYNSTRRGRRDHNIRRRRDYYPTGQR